MFLPVDMSDMRERGWDQADFVLVTGDAYVDHHSFGTAIIGRLLERYGYRVGILAQPDYRSPEAFRTFGKPRLGFLINGGVCDSMVSNYSVFRNRRKKDVYSPGGKPGNRPDRAVIVYANRAREAYGDVPIIIGGIEASLRRFSHYDYWDDAIRRSVLMDSRADLLIYGMGERAVLNIAEALDSGINVKDITWIRGTCYRTGECPEDAVILPPYEQVREDPRVYAESFATQYRENDHVRGRKLAEPCQNMWVVQNPPDAPLDQMEMDDIYELPFENAEHTSYAEAGGIPATFEITFSITANRGCMGDCSFCALTFHQGRHVTGRSRESIVREAERLTQHPGFKGIIHDIGGPTANFYGARCEKMEKNGACINKRCMHPEVCSNMTVTHSGYMEVLRDVMALPGVRKVFIRSGIRYDYLMADKDSSFLEQLCRHHVSGTLKVAPEHTCKSVLDLMGKPGIGVFDRFVKEYRRMNKRLGKEQCLIPYLISSHPGSTMDDAVDMALYLKEFGFIPDQVQDFYPTPGTLSTVMFCTGIDPLTGKEVYVPREIGEKRIQRALIHYRKPENNRYLRQAEQITGRKEIRSLIREAEKRNEHSERNRKGDRKRKSPGRKAYKG